MIMLTNEFQFRYIEGILTTQCTSMVIETYFNHEGSNVYGLLLDAGKAFDRIIMSSSLPLIMLNEKG